jgi:hypothetical protein
VTQETIKPALRVYRGKSDEQTPFILAYARRDNLYFPNNTNTIPRPAVFLDLPWHFVENHTLS